MQEKNKTVCIIGMGYVGLTLGIAFAKAGFKVIGIENNPRTLDLLRNCKPQVHEENLADEYVALYKSGKITIEEKIPDPCPANIYIITVGTPLDREGHSSMEPIRKVANSVANVLKDGDLVILRSTVKVGTTLKVVKPILDKSSKNYLLAMAPERTVEGLALKELFSLPQIIGGVNAASTARAEELFKELGVEIVPVSSAQAAELAKLICNTQRDLYYAYSNEVALLAEELGLDALEVINAANKNYSRCNLAKPGLVGGPCLEKDVYILAESMGQTLPELALTARKLHESMVDHAVEMMVSKVVDKEPKKVVILGLAFKGEPETGDIRGSMAIPLAKKIASKFPLAKITGYDPVASVEEAALWGLTAEEKLEDALQDADIIFIQTNHRMFRTDDFAKKLGEHCSNKPVYDFWRCIQIDNQHGFDYIALGCGNISDKGKKNG